MKEDCRKVNTEDETNLSGHDSGRLTYNQKIDVLTDNGACTRLLKLGGAFYFFRTFNAAA